MLSLILTGIASCLFYFPYRKEVKMVVSSIETTRHYYSLIEYGAQVIGTALLILVVWLWKKELGIHSLGPLSGKSIEDQLSPQSEENEQKGTFNTATGLGAAPDQAEALKGTELKRKIIELIQQRHHVGEGYVSYKLEITSAYARKLLQELVNTGELAHSSFRDSGTYIDPEFYENKAIDWVVNRLRTQYPDLTRIYKFVKFAGIEYDAVAETNDQIFFIEINKKGTKTIEKFKHFKEQAVKKGFRFDNKKCLWIYGIIVPKGEGFGTDLFDPNYISIVTLDIPDTEL